MVNFFKFIVVILVFVLVSISVEHKVNSAKCEGRAHTKYGDYKMINGVLHCKTNSNPVVYKAYKSI